MPAVYLSQRLTCAHDHLGTHRVRIPAGQDRAGCLGSPRRGKPHRAVLDANPDPIVEHIGQRLSDGDESVLTKTAAELRAEIVSRACATR